MKLVEKQQIFASLVPRLIAHAIMKGYQVTLGETWRSPEEAKRLAKLGLGIVNSLHTRKLAIDIDLWKDGKLLDDSKDYKFLGEYWESLGGPLFQTCWGGRFKRVDGRHFSIADGGQQ